MQIHGIIQGDIQMEKRYNNRTLGNISTYGQRGEKKQGDRKMRKNKKRII